MSCFDARGLRHHAATLEPDPAGATFRTFRTGSWSTPQWTVRSIGAKGAQQHSLATLLAQVTVLGSIGAIQIACAAGVNAETPRFAVQHQRTFVPAWKDDSAVVEFRPADFGCDAEERGNIARGRCKRLAHRVCGIDCINDQRQRRHADSNWHPRRLASRKPHRQEAGRRHGQAALHCAPSLCGSRGIFDIAQIFR